MKYYSKDNHINSHDIDIDRLKKDTVIIYQAKRFGGVDYEPPLKFVAKVVLDKPFCYAPKSWAIQVINLKQDDRLNDTHIMYKAVKAVDVDDIVKIGL